MTSICSSLARTSRARRLSVPAEAAALVVVAAAALCGGCKVDTWRKHKADAEAAATDTGQPRLAQAADAIGESARSVDMDERTGRAKATLVLRLDHFPDPRPGAASLPACYPPFDAEFSLGLVECEGRPDTRRPLTAKNVEQDCYTDPKRARVPPAEPLSMPGCRRASLALHRYDPPLVLDIEVRDVN